MSDLLPSVISEEYGLARLNDSAALIRDNVGNGEMSMRTLKQIHIPAGGSTTFEVETLRGVQTMREIAGIVVAWTEQRRYYADAYNPGADVKPPECASTDLIIGTGNPGGRCKDCPFNQWGTSRAPDGGEGRGKACAQYRYLLMLQPGKILPVVVAVPPSSLGAAKAYFLDLAAEGLRYDHVVTQVTLEKGQPVATMRFQLLAELARPDIEAVSTYGSDMENLFLNKEEVIEIQ